MRYKEFKMATKLFGLEGRTSLEQVKARHRELVKKHHPDQAGDTDPEAIRKVNFAYEVLMDYCNSYRFCFSEEEYLEQVPEERLRRQFSWDPAWEDQGEADED
jgi:DnaJ-class molecular chaperone